MKLCIGNFPYTTFILAAFSLSTNSLKDPRWVKQIITVDSALRENNPTHLTGIEVQNDFCYVTGNLTKWELVFFSVVNRCKRWEVSGFLPFLNHLLVLLLHLSPPGLYIFIRAEQWTVQPLQSVSCFKAWTPLGFHLHTQQLALSLLYAADTDKR